MNCKLLLIVVVGITTIATAKAANPENGKMLFQGRCASCHNVTKKLTGPALAGVEDRHPEAWIISFVKGSQAMVKSGDAAALEVFNKNNQVIMPDHPDLSDDQIRDILAYIKETAANAPKEDDAPFSRPGQKEPNLMPLSIYNFPFMIAYLVLIVVMVILLVFLVNIKSYEHHIHKDD
ncbi:Cytochrome c, mono-and diheme variants [Chitinophaga jiangningensis]|uniref:Cytochrome c, mono-and diheme variants n=1 Tax=Chitinophaga jiangningensis TaxID=1419482 RepID=A0A1M7A256_9BACT|nr:cytochrome c [Chitinophaga jiangningensis]SHL36766.1 Cytochrome c, mono-and diheme variants [Chitinophaga jiangningensis]